MYSLMKFMRWVINDWFHFARTLTSVWSTTCSVLSEWLWLKTSQATRAGFKLFPIHTIMAFRNTLTNKPIGKFISWEEWDHHYLYTKCVLHKHSTIWLILNFYYRIFDDGRYFLPWNDSSVNQFDPYLYFSQVVGDGNILSHPPRRWYSSLLSVTTLLSSAVSIFSPDEDPSLDFLAETGRLETPAEWGLWCC